MRISWTSVVTVVTGCSLFLWGCGGNPPELNGGLPDANGTVVFIVPDSGRLPIVILDADSLGRDIPIAVTVDGGAPALDSTPASFCGN